MHNFTIYAQVIDGTDPTDKRPLGVFLPTGTDSFHPQSFDAADAEQAVKLWYLEGEGQQYTADDEARILGDFGLDYFTVQVFDNDTKAIYFGHVHIEWGGDEYVRHYEFEPLFDIPPSRVHA